MPESRLVPDRPSRGGPGSAPVPSDLMRRKQTEREAVDGLDLPEHSQKMTTLNEVAQRMAQTAGMLANESDEQRALKIVDALQDDMDALAHAVDPDAYHDWDETIAGYRRDTGVDNV
jgi:hypothetical protein